MKKIILLSFLLIFNFSFLIDVAAEIRYVSKTGTSTPPYTSWETASDSIQKCINVCENGDTVIVANGVYREFLTIDTAITLLGISMDSTVIDGTGLGSYYTIEANNHLTIKELKIIGKGFNANPQYTAVSNIFFNLNVTKCEISNSNIGLYIGQSSGIIDSVIIHNIIRGVYTFCGYDTCKPVIKNSVIILRDDPNKGDVNGITNFHGGQPLIENNIIIEEGNFARNGILNLNPVKKLVIKNNLIARFWSNIDASYVIDSTYIINNVLRDQNSENNFDGSIYNPNNRANIRNNIISNSKKGIHLASTPNTNYNLFWNNQVNANNGTAFGPNDVFADPMFVKDTIANSFAYNYHLQKYSPAIDAGDPSILDVDSTRSDIGMFGGPEGTSYIYLDLPPKPPKNFNASYDSGLVKIKWDKYSEADFSHYNIYRSTIINFIPDSINLYRQTDTSYFVDTVSIKKEKLYYRITAIDSAGNESIPGEQIVVIITDTGDALIEVVGEYKLYQNYPNPFNPVTTIPFRLKERSSVKIMVYDIKGELIETIINETRDRGFYEIKFNTEGLSTGIYLYRIEIIGEGNIPVYMEMKKMLLIK